MGALVRAHDWGRSPLGAPSIWPESLRSTVQLMLGTSHPAGIFWGKRSYCFYNDAFARLMGPERHPGSLARPGRDVWSEAWHVIGPQITQVMSGEGATWHENQLVPITRHGRREDVFWTYGFSPIEDANAAKGVGGVLLLVTETTQSVLVQRRGAFLSELGAVLQTLSDTRTILQTALRGLGIHLQASRVGYTDVESQYTVHLTTPFTDDIEPLSDNVRLDGFSPAMIARERQGIAASCDDVNADREGSPEFWAAIHTRAFVSVPLMRGGRFVASLGVHQRHPRHWTDDEIGVIEAVANRIWDAMERVKASAALRASEARFRAALQVTGILWTNDADGRMTGEQPGWAELTGQTQAEYEGYGWVDALHPEDAQTTLDAWHKAVAERRMFNITHRVRLHDGEYCYFNVRATPVLSEDGTVQEWVGVHLDITEQRAAEQKLRVLNATLEARVQKRTRERDRMWRNSRDLLVTLGTDGIFHDVSPAFSKLLGYERDDANGKCLLDFVSEQDRQPTQEALQAAAGGASLSDFTNRFVHADGSLRSISWYTCTEGDKIYAYGRDITEEQQQKEALRLAEEQLRQAQKMEAVGQLTGGLAHDFNNLLAGVTGSLERLETRIAQGRTGEIGRYVTAAQGAARRAAALTQRLLAFSRRQTLAPIAVNANSLIAGMDDLIRRAVGPSIEVEVVGLVNLWPCRVDANQLENALLNLCINARDAMPNGGRLTIATHNRYLDAREAAEHDLPVGQYVTLSVTDTGTGMSGEVQARAFDPFFTTKPLGQGTGLGLSMIYGFARQSGGQIRISSKLGFGTTMTLYLPRLDGPASEAGHRSASHATGNELTDRTVLVVDDEPSMRMLVTDVLEDCGLHAIEANDGASALRILQSSAPVDILITDMGLPGGPNGRQVADAGRALRPSLKVLFITGYSEKAVIGDNSLDDGMTIMTKPFPMEDLAVRIRGMI